MQLLEADSLQQVMIDRMRERGAHLHAKAVLVWASHMGICKYPVKAYICSTRAFLARNISLTD